MEWPAHLPLVWGGGVSLPEFDVLLGGVAFVW